IRAVVLQLLGHATANDAGAADAIFLRHRDLRSECRRHAGSPHAARSRSDDEKVEVVVAHISIRCIAPAYGASPAELQIGIWLSSSRKRDGPARQSPPKARSINAMVDGTKPFGPSASMDLAISLPSSTPNWSTGLIPIITLLAPALGRATCREIVFQ